MTSKRHWEHLKDTTKHWGHLTIHTLQNIRCISQWHHKQVRHHSSTSQKQWRHLSQRHCEYLKDITETMGTSYNYITEHWAHLDMTSWRYLLTIIHLTRLKFRKRELYNTIHIYVSQELVFIIKILTSLFIMLRKMLTRSSIKSIGVNIYYHCTCTCIFVKKIKYEVR